MAGCALQSAIAETVQTTMSMSVSFQMLILPNLEERKQFLEKNNDYFNGGALEEVVVNGKKILRHTKGCG
jgi:hypothetical protein